MNQHSSDSNPADARDAEIARLLDERAAYQAKRAKEHAEEDALLGEVILRVGTEGGSLTLRGHHQTDDWYFVRHLDDWTPTLEDEPAISHQSHSTTSWAEVLELLDTYPWFQFSPREVHPEFREKIWQAFCVRHQKEPVRSSRYEDWRSACRIGP